ncbi:FAD-dependent oxidoreductase [Pontivivens ytuae]|uniref:FAD-dependent oxidoreductase n=1 Tax=Pontivivens ytuae TaxID=2789856 RepID=A0A7S9LQJ4_9RHOB|nr:FAD-dependent oxidoreductase [Pontivivens ytuae]QPH53459.1 FAD-dependent oxidoreductase [Pontivivens ytuae]
MPFDYKPFPYRRAPGLDATEPTHPVVIVGAGPIGLAMAVDLATQGVRSVLLDDNDVVSVGSRAICWAKRTLEIFDRLGVGERMVEKGVTWQVGRLFDGEEEVFSFDLLPEEGHKMPAFINLGQYYVEQYLVERCHDFPDLIDLRFKNRVASVTNGTEGVEIEVETPDGPYTLTADWLIACDGARSPVRGMLGLDFAGRVFEERFLIADIVMEADFPSERWFWFNPPFHGGQTALLHKQPDNIYRIDLQLGWDADPEEEKKPENVIPRIEKAVGGRPFELDWVSVYTFQCRRLEKFVHDRVVFVGDSAHVVSPFGARGGNGGIHDVDNLGWKLAAVIKGEATPELVATYDIERRHGADENILNSTRATNFLSPPNAASGLFRDAVLDLARDHAFARPLINSGRLSRPCTLAGLLPGEERAGPVRVGDPCPDAPIGNGWLLDRLGGRFVLLAVERGVDDPMGLEVVEATGETMLNRYGPGVFLIRPDQHIAASWDGPTPADIRTALDRAMGRA